jgi:hypothetical protein
LTERRGNLYENKGLAFNSLGLSGNVIESKGTYASKAGMLLKRSRIQDPGVRRKLRQRVSHGEQGDKLLFSLWTRGRSDKGKERGCNFKNLANNAAMSMKTKDRLSAAWG